MKRIITLIILLLVIAAVSGCGDEGRTETATSGLEKKSVEGGGVTVSVTPQNVSPGGGDWTFNVVMDTHTVELSDDPAQVSMLVADGREYKPLAWEGDPPGGHHRVGTLSFATVSPAPKSIELIIRDIGGIERRYEWNIE